MLLVLLPALMQAQQARTLSLSLGATISDGQGGSYRYEAVEDTYLDREQPDKNAGGEFSLSGGKDRTILIRFGDLERALGPHRKIKTAKLVLTPDTPDKPQLSSVSRVLLPWGEGPLLVVGKPFIKGTGKDALPAPAFSATWKDRRAGTSWALAGARSEADAQPILNARQTTAGDQIEVDGLADAVQKMADDPDHNYGFALVFSGPCDFESSQSAKDRPRLELQVEKTAPATGPDLSVTRIDVTPTLDAAGQKPWPAKGEEVSYTAHIRNVGDAPAPKGFIARWSFDERVGSALEIDKPLAPGEETTVTSKQNFTPQTGDHRGGSVQFTLTPRGPDAEARNDSAQIWSNARPIGIVVEESFAKSLGGYIADWAQAQMRVLNGVYLPHSRYSFAPDGVKERFRLQSLLVVPDGSAATQHQGEDLDAMVAFSAADKDLNAVDQSTTFVKRLGLALGLPDLGTMNLSYDRTQGQSPKVSADRFGGVMGGGDTRFEGTLPAFFVLPYEPYSNPIFDVVQAEPSGLFAATDVFAMNNAIDSRGKLKGSLDMPTTTLIKAIGLDGKPLVGAELSFFQSKAGKIDDGAPAFTVVTDAGGTATLPNRTTNPFGQLDPSGSNGLFMIRASANGVTDYGWLKAWQLADAFHRTGRPAPLFELRFSLPSQPLDTSVNLADGRPVKNSVGDLPAKLTPLVDGKTDTGVALPSGKDAWVEVDLGRDRAVGEVQLIVKSPTFWQKFDVLGYATGQEATAVEPWTKELDYAWSSVARGDKDASGAVVLHYRGTAARFRYVRIVCRDAGPGTSELSEIRVLPVKG